MAKYIPIGEPANHSEADSIRALRDQLPKHYIVIGNFELQLPNRANTFEYDAVVIGEHGLYAVEVKGWSGEIHGDLRRWYLEWGRVQNPLILTERKAKALRGFVSRAVPDLPQQVFCQSVVLLPTTANVCVDDPRSDRILTLDHFYDFFVDEARIREFGPGSLLDAELRTRIQDALLPIAAPASQTPRIADYEIIGEYDDNDRPYREFIGRHRLLRSRSRVRIKRYALDPLATADDHARQHERALRDMEALTELDANPYIASAYEVIRDQEDELNFYLVSEWVGSETLVDYMQAHPTAEIDVRPLARHLLLAVQYMHERGITHRNLSPAVIYMTGDSDRVPLKITDFDYARVMHLPSIDGTFEELGNDGYAAPELWRSDDYDHRVDLFSVGAILYELLTGERLYASLTQMLHHDQTWSERRARLPDEQCRILLDGLLQADPNERCDVETALSMIAEPESPQD